MDFLSKPMGWILAQLSDLFANNFALSVLVFTVLVNIIILPLTLKSQKSTAKQARIKHKLDALKKKYGDDRQKYSTAMQELYNKEGISMGGGCLPMIVRLIIMMGVYYAVVSPFTYVVGVDKGALTAASNWASYVRVAEDYGDDDISTDDWKALGLEERAKKDDVLALVNDKELNTTGKDADYFAKLLIVEDVAKMKSSDIKDDSPEERVAKKVSSCRITREVELASYLNKGNKAYSPIIEKKFVESKGNIKDLNSINFDLFGIDLTDTPEFSWNLVKGWNPNWLIPIASFLAAVITGVVTSAIQKKANPEAPNMMAMMLFMPIISLIIAFGFPCAVGFYWACSSLVSGGIQIATQLLYGPAVVNTREQAKNIIARANQEKSRMAKVDNGSAE